MSVERFVQAMPKVELNLQFEGALQKDVLLLIAEQNDIPDSLKHYNQWVQAFDRPDYQRLDELIQVIGKWIKQPEDLTRLVYELGVSLAKQNVRYAEVTIDPILYTENGMTFEQFLNAINDGRDRVERGWHVKMAWILAVQRDQPRRADDVVRWASSASAKKNGVIGMALIGREDAQPSAQFERAFKTAQKKSVQCVVNAGDRLGAEGVLDAIHVLQPNRIIDGWGTADAPDVLGLLREHSITLEVSLARALCMGWVESYANYPLRHLYDEDIQLVIGTGMPSLYKTTLSQEYLAVVEHCGFSIGELEELALRAVENSLLMDEEKTDLSTNFKAEYEKLHAEYNIKLETTV
ncbi:MAG: hypothetical protein K8L97_02645 [Anaerolineae bacterium]|nr:hypothetical protein [Anaerolineae bacterium]